MAVRVRPDVRNMLDSGDEVIALMAPSFPASFYFIDRYWALLYEHLPEGNHYRILQNASYLVIVILFFVQIITGVLLIEAEGSLPTQVIILLGGINAVRQGHLFLTWVFAVFTVIHVYMAFTEDFPKVKLIFLGMADEKYSGQ